MPAELLALGAAICYASGGIAAKYGTQTGGILAGLPATLVSGIVVVGVIAIFTVESWVIPIHGVVLFGLAGLAGPGVGRLFLMRGVRDVGASVTVPVYSSSYPVVATIAAVVIFGEFVDAPRVMALALIIAGIWACGRGGSANVAEQETDGPLPSSWQRAVPLLWPLSAGSAFAVADVVRKFGLAVHGDPILGALIGLIATLVCWTALSVFVSKLRLPVRMTRSNGWFLLSGVLNGLAQVSLLFALHVGEVSVVSPIVASQPVVVIILGLLLLRGVERPRPGHILGAVTVFAGVAFLSLT